MSTGTWLFFANNNSPIIVIPIFNVPIYMGVIALAINLTLVILLTPVFNLLGVKNGHDATTPSDYVEEMVPAEPVESKVEALST
jgi:hypothetical protein